MNAKEIIVAVIGVIIALALAFIAPVLLPVAIPMLAFGFKKLGVMPS